MKRHKAYLMTHLDEVRGRGTHGRWRNWLAFCRLLEQIDFGCKFEENNCKQSRDRDNRHVPERICCCSCCSEMIGHRMHEDIKRFGEIMPASKVAEFRQTVLDAFKPSSANMFDKSRNKAVSHGFWRIGTGCALPRWARSRVCMDHHCGGKKIDVIIGAAYRALYEKKLIPVRKLRAKAKRAGVLLPRARRTAAVS